MMRLLLLIAITATTFAVAGCPDSRSTPAAGLDSAQAVAVAFRLAGPDRPPGFNVRSFTEDTAGYVILMGPPLVELGAKGDTVAVNVGGRLEVRVRPNGQGTILYRGQ